MSFVHFPAAGVIRPLAGGQDIVPFPGGPGGQGFALSPDGKRAWAAVGWNALVVQPFTVAFGTIYAAGPPVRVFEWAGYVGPVTLTTDGRDLYVSQRADGVIVRLDASTLKPTGRIETGRPEVAVVVAPVQPPPVVADPNPDVSFGSGTPYVYIAFDAPDTIVPATDKAWLCKSVVDFYAGIGINLRVSTRRPKLEKGKTPLAPRDYGVVRILPSAQWPFGMLSGMASPSSAWNANAVGWKGEGERAVWVWVDEVAYRRQYGREDLFHTVCHEMAHAIGGLADLYKGTDRGPAGNLMSVPATTDPTKSMDLTPEQIRWLQMGVAGWMGKR